MVTGCSNGGALPVTRPTAISVYSGVVILSLFGLAVGRLINWLETRLLHWR